MAIQVTIKSGCIGIRQFFTHQTFPNPDSSKFSTVKNLHHTVVTAAGDDLLIVDHIQTTVRIQHHTVTHSYIVVNTLITPAILEIDFLQQHGIIIDFASSPINISIPPIADSTVINPASNQS